MNALLLPKLNGSSSGRFHRGFAFLQRQYFEPIQVDDLVKASGMSRRGWYKAFQRHTGRSPGRELRRLRIERAKELLVNSDWNLRAIARMCGYRSANSFWISFREIVGESPGTYRSRFRRDSNAKS
jgi:AraC family transcriptional regulator, transcriptional activator FtrA